MYAEVLQVNYTLHVFRLNVSSLQCTLKLEL
jgi:hypothetical protein